MKHRPKIGIALSSGISRGIAHVGVLNVLQKNNIPIDYVAGTSMGAIVGALFCTGEEMDIWVKMATMMPIKHLVDLSFAKKGLIKGRKIRNFFNFILKNRTFEDLKIPLSVVATDLIKCESVVFNEGNLADALRASSSIPGAFEPYSYNGKILIDGGATDRVPTTILKNMGADFIIVSDVGFNGGAFEARTFLDVILRTFGIMEKEILKTRMLCADVIIKPEVDDIDSTIFTQAELCMKRGEEAAEKAIPQILEAIQAKGNETHDSKVKQG